MLHRRFRRVMDDERGQALVLGAVGLLVMAIMVLASVSLGDAIYQKIKLQDAADAQSYSIAVKETRAYNFFAYTNRAMVVHYCAMLTFMSYLSHAYYLKETIGKTAKYLKYLPYVGPIFNAVEQAINAWMKIVDAIAMAAIPVLSALNIGLWLAQEAMLVATWFSIFTTGASEPLKKTDPKAEAGYATMGGFPSSIGEAYNYLSNAGLNLMNANNFLHPVDDGIRGSYYGSHGNMSGSDPFGLSVRAKLLGNQNKLSVPEMYKYRMLMGNIANSARREWTARGKGPVLLGRKWSINICVVIGQIKFQKTADSQLRSFSEDYENNRRDQLWAVEDINLRVRAGCWWPSKWHTIFSYKIRVAADNQRGYHQVGFGRWAPKQDKHHPFPGITPFILNDTSYFIPWAYSFGEPDNLVVATKKMPKQVFQMKTSVLKGVGDHEKSGELDMTWSDVGTGNAVDNKIAALFKSRIGEGMMAVSSARAVYHRPGVWKEEPNFFNPLWTPRLVAVNTNWEWKNRLDGLMLELVLLRGAMGDNAFNY